jgi:hypothetical protein
VNLTPEQVNAARSLQAVDVPSGVYRVEGCSCGGGAGIHLFGCAIFRLSPDEVCAAELEAERRSAQFGAALTAAFYGGFPEMLRMDEDTARG